MAPAAALAVVGVASGLMAGPNWAHNQHFPFFFAILPAIDASTA
jgi:hypothetical protein